METLDSPLPTKDSASQPKDEKPSTEGESRLTRAISFVLAISYLHSAKPPFLGNYDYGISNSKEGSAEFLTNWTRKDRHETPGNVNQITWKNQTYLVKKKSKTPKTCRCLSNIGKYKDKWNNSFKEQILKNYKWGKASPIYSEPPEAATLTIVINFRTQ